MSKKDIRFLKEHGAEYTRLYGWELNNTHLGKNAVVAAAQLRYWQSGKEENEE